MHDRKSECCQKPADPEIERPRLLRHAELDPCRELDRLALLPLPRQKVPLA